MRMITTATTTVIAMVSEQVGGALVSEFFIPFAQIVFIYTRHDSKLFKDHDDNDEGDDTSGSASASVARAAIVFIGAAMAIF